VGEDRRDAKRSLSGDEFCAGCSQQGHDGHYTCGQCPRTTRGNRGCLAVLIVLSITLWLLPLGWWGNLLAGLTSVVSFLLILAYVAHQHSGKSYHRRENSNLEKERK